MDRFGDTPGRWPLGAHCPAERCQWGDRPGHRLQLFACQLVEKDVDSAGEAGALFPPSATQYPLMAGAQGHQMRQAPGRAGGWAWG